jgi:hypothetical protein
MHGDEEIVKKDQQLSDEDVENVVGGAYEPSSVQQGETRYS